MKLFRTKKHKGSAVVIALLLVGTLTLIGVTLSALINNETRQIAETIRNGQANYLSEAGTEVGLYFVHQTPPGSSPQNNTLDTNYSLTQSSNTRNIVNSLAQGGEAGLNNQPTQEFSLQIDSRSNHLPILEDYILEQGLQNKTNPDIRRNLFEPLPLNSSVTIPLTDAKNFQVEYYFALDSGGYRSDWDILLWKLFGTNAQGQIENLSEYFPATGSNAQGEKNTANSIGSSSVSPASFGTLTPEQGFNCGTFFPAEQETILKTDNNQSNDLNICGTLIQEFLNSHTNAYLVLTNAVNTSVFGEDTSLFDIANIYWRICTPNCSDSIVQKNWTEKTNQFLVPKFTKLTSKGTFNLNSKFLYTSINPEGFLPVFDFSIYRTKN